MPRSLAEALGRMLKGDPVLARPDRTARAAYEMRMAETIAQGQDGLAPEPQKEAV
jgi:hypothetical protein